MWVSQAQLTGTGPQPRLCEQRNNGLSIILHVTQLSQRPLAGRRVLLCRLDRVGKRLQINNETRTLSVFLLN